MAEKKAAFPPSYQRKADRLRKAFEAYLDELRVLRSERDDIVRKFMERIEHGRIDDVRKMLNDL